MPNDGLFNFDEMTVQMEPAIAKFGFTDLGDSPSHHRWRAWWVTETMSTGRLEVIGIELHAYPVVKTNPASVWIDDLAHRENGPHGPEWVFPLGRPVRRRICYNDSNAAWAKPTQDEAIRSLAVRLTRWASHIETNTTKALSAAKVLNTLRPDLKPMADFTTATLGEDRQDKNNV